MRKDSNYNNHRNYIFSPFIHFLEVSRNQNQFFLVVTHDDYCLSARNQFDWRTTTMMSVCPWRSMDRRRGTCGTIPARAELCSHKLYPAIFITSLSVVCGSLRHFDSALARTRPDPERYEPSTPT